MIDRIISRKVAASKKSLLLLGPRQTGKSTLVHSLKPDLEINLFRESEFLAFSANSSELEQRVSATNPTSVFIDEVQRLPSVLNTVQVLADEAARERRSLKFFLTGSSARKLKRAQANLLPGRILLYHLGPLTAGELGDRFNARRAMEVGTLPEPYLEEDRSLAEKLLETYAGTYLKEEIQLEALSRKLEGFSRFLMVVAGAAGGALDFSKLAQQARVSRTSTVRYFEILEDTLIATRILPYPDATQADMVKHPRLYFFDCGVLNGLLGNFSASADRIGKLFENLVASQLRAAAAAHDEKLELYTFRTRGGLEIDFIARLNNVTWAIEAKATANVHDSDAKALATARPYLSTDVRFVIVIPEGARRRLKSGVEVMPLSAFLREIV